MARRAPADEHLAAAGKMPFDDRHAVVHDERARRDAAHEGGVHLPRLRAPVGFPDAQVRPHVDLGGDRGDAAGPDDARDVRGHEFDRPHGDGGADHVALGDAAQEDGDVLATGVPEARVEAAGEGRRAGEGEGDERAGAAGERGPEPAATEVAERVVEGEGSHGQALRSEVTTSARAASVAGRSPEKRPVRTAAARPLRTTSNEGVKATETPSTPIEEPIRMATSAPPMPTAAPPSVSTSVSTRTIPARCGPRTRG